MDKIVLALLHKNNINNIAKEELKFQIATHPSYPSLHAITGVLDHFGIENMALDIPQNNEVFTQLPKHFIAQLKNETGENLVFIEKKDKQVIVYLDHKKKNKLTRSKFLEAWTGIVVVVDEETIHTTNKNINKKYSAFLPLFFLVVITLFSLFKFTSFNVLNLGYLVLSFAGVYISTLLIKHELGINSNTVTKLCTATKKTSCDAVLNSKAATILGKFKLSDLSFVYFVSIALTSLIISLTTKNTTILTTLSLFAVPAVLYSVVYQGFIIKKWCPLCLATAGVLIAQAGIAYIVNPFVSVLEIKGFLILSISALSIISLYNIIKSLITAKLTLTKSKVAYFKFKRNFNLFNTLYQNKPTLNTTIANTNEIVFGNKNATVHLVAITNPLCGYCKATHQAIDTLLNSNSKNFKATIRFNINTTSKEDTAYKIANTLLNLYQNDVTICKEAMHQIYTNGVDVNKWLDTYNKDYKIDFYEVLETEKKWCTNNNINFTPAVYLNNKEYPKEYDLSDLSFFIDDLSHLSSSQKEETKKQAETKMLIKNKNIITKHNVIPTE